MSTLEDILPGTCIMDGLFQAFSTRTAGVVDLEPELASCCMVSVTVDDVYISFAPWLFHSQNKRL